MSEEWATAKRVSEEALRLITGARRFEYGPPEESFAQIARFWAAYLQGRFGVSVFLTAADVAPMMRLLKEARLCKGIGRYDSLVDLVGYTLLDAEIHRMDGPAPAVATSRSDQATSG